MANKDAFTEAAQAEIVDSLEDARESHENAYELLQGEAAELAAQLAYAYGNVLHAFMDGFELSNDALSLIFKALQASYENCIEAGLTHAADDYEQAALEVQQNLI